MFVNGGNLQYDPFFGEPRSAVFDPQTHTFTNVQNMAHGRWYPTVTTLGDGRVMTFSGLLETGGTNSAVEIYTVGSGWSAEFPAGWTPPLYPRMHLSTDGRVFYAGSGRGSRFFNPATNTWTAVVANTIFTGSRGYGTSVLLPLTPANGYRPRVMILGGASPATATTEIIDLSASTPAWQSGPSMSRARIQMSATILPNGKVLATGGSVNDEDAGTASLNADLYDPATNTFSSAGANLFARLYHSASLLLPDATVLLIGGNPQRGNYERRLEIYSPAYLFDATGGPALRPTITGVPSAPIGYGGSFQVQTPDAATISSVVLVRPGAATHAFDMDQRLVGMNFTAGNGVLNVTAPPNGNIAPPGYYMLFVLNGAGVPSVAKFVRLLPNAAPTATITSPAGNVTVNPGGSVSFAGTGSDPDGTISAYSWTFPGGTPASSTAGQRWRRELLDAWGLHGDVQGDGQSRASERTRDADDHGFRFLPVGDTGVANGPAWRRYHVHGDRCALERVHRNRRVQRDRSSFGRDATFNPASVSTSGSTTMSVSTSAATPPGSYPLTIQGTSGPRTRTANVTLVVGGGDFSISATPASQTIARGGVANYTVTITAGQGFSGTVNLSVSGVPPRATATFNPASIVNAGTSTLTIDTEPNVQKRTRTLTITGTGGGRTHSATVTLIIQ